MMARKKVLKKPRICWQDVLKIGVKFVESNETRVTLRQLFYHLVSGGHIENTIVAYTSLSNRTAKARRAGTFPALMDRGRTIHRYQTFDGPDEAREWLARIYLRDRTEGQTVTIYLGVEKAGIVEQVREWFGELGVPILALGGYTSQTYVDEIVGDVEADGRPAILLYAGDFDASGEDIDRDFVERTNCWTVVQRVALTPEQVEEYELPPFPGKASDTRAAQFIEKHGKLIQVELDALSPDVLRKLFADAISEHWNKDAYSVALKKEKKERRSLAS